MKANKIKTFINQLLGQTICQELEIFFINSIACINAQQVTIWIVKYALRKKDFL